jgi:hypothetical protein
LPARSHEALPGLRLDPAAKAKRSSLQQPQMGRRLERLSLV